jgi:cytochrome c553
MTSPFRSATLALLLAFAPVAVTTTPAAAQSAPGASPNDWLLNAPDDQTRFRLLQQQASGFHVSMQIVGQRYQALYDAVSDGNWDFAVYQWEKIRETIQAGYQRRPLRQPNADREFLQKVYEPVRAGLRSREQATGWAAFQQARTACMACHEAERVAFMNDQPLFRRTAAPRP